MPINAHPEYLEAEKRYQQASSDDERLKALEEMIRFLPTHKGAENLLKNIRTRYKKLKQDMVRKAKKGRGKKGIKKEGMQVVLVGLTNSGKSSVLKLLTNAYPRIASYGFTTEEPMVGILYHRGCNIQIIDLPPIGSENFDKGIVNNADTLLVVVEKLHEIKEVFDAVNNKTAKRIVVFNKIDLYDAKNRRKISETLKSKKYNFVLVSAFGEGVEELKDKVLNSFDFIRVYTQHPGKREKLDNVPVIVAPGSTLRDVAEKILHGYSKKVKYAKVSGPSSKFLGQRVGLKHVVKDNDVVEFFSR